MNSAQNRAPPRGIDFPIYYSAFEDDEADSAAVAAVDDAGFDPGWVQGVAVGSIDASAGGCGGLPVGIGLAGGD